MTRANCPRCGRLTGAPGKLCATCRREERAEDRRCRRIRRALWKKKK